MPWSTNLQSNKIHCIKNTALLQYQPHPDTTPSLEFLHFLKKHKFLLHQGGEQFRRGVLPEAVSKYWVDTEVYPYGNL